MMKLSRVIHSVIISTTCHRHDFQKKFSSPKPSNISLVPRRWNSSETRLRVGRRDFATERKHRLLARVLSRYVMYEHTWPRKSDVYNHNTRNVVHYILCTRRITICNVCKFRINILLRRATTNHVNITMTRFYRKKTTRRRYMNQHTRVWTRRRARQYYHSRAGRSRRGWNSRVHRIVMEILCCPLRRWKIIIFNKTAFITCRLFVLCTTTRLINGCVLILQYATGRRKKISARISSARCGRRFAVRRMRINECS